MTSATSPGAPPGTVLTRGTVTIDIETCKGCDLCIAACPPRVLVMTTDKVNALGHRYPQLLPGCTGCQACQWICPDFCFAVFKYDTPQHLPIAADRAEPGTAR